MNSGKDGKHLAREFCLKFMKKLLRLGMNLAEVKAEHEGTKPITVPNTCINLIKNNPSVGFLAWSLLPIYSPEIRTDQADIPITDITLARFLLVPPTGSPFQLGTLLAQDNQNLNLV